MPSSLLVPWMRRRHPHRGSERTALEPAKTPRNLVRHEGVVFDRLVSRFELDCVLVCDVEARRASLLHERDDRRVERMRKSDFVIDVRILVTDIG